MRKRIVAGNWKMNLSIEQAQQLLTDLESEYLNEKECHLIICPPSVYIDLSQQLQSNISVGSQNVSQFDNGAYTGEISAAMLHSLGVTYCIVGHSERRMYFGDTSEIINKKISQLLSESIIPIVCCGETLEERDAGNEKKVVRTQLLEALDGLSSDEVGAIVVAYEPVWAIGTGRTASRDQAQEMHAFIREVLNIEFGLVSEVVPILYGGSCKPDNAQDLFSCKDIDGGLIGGASLDAKSFFAIANAF